MCKKTSENLGYTFISGATGGIGKAFAIKYATLGKDLILTGRSAEKLEGLKAELLNVNGNIDVKTVACQLTDENDRKAMLAKIASFGVKIENIVNVAGVDTQKGFLDYTYDKVVFQIRVNVESTISLTHALLALRAKKANVITVSSMSAVTPMPYFAIYSATKECLINFFTALRLELKDKNVNVTTVLPGGVYTRPDIVEAIKHEGIWGKLSSKQPEFVAKKSVKAVKRNKAIYIPGGFNKFLYVIMKITPRCISMRFIKNRWKKISKDAF